MSPDYYVKHGRSFKDGKESKTKWTTIGVAFEKDGNIRVVLNYVPVPNEEGVIGLMLFPPKDEE